MYYVGQCSVCGNGVRGVRICCGTPIVVCDECDAVWTSPDTGDRRSAAADPECAKCGNTLWGSQAHWASQAEVQDAGWWANVQGEARPHHPPETTNCDLSQQGISAPPQQAEVRDSSDLPITAAGAPLVVILAMMIAGGVVAALAIL